MGVEGDFLWPGCSAERARNNGEHEEWCMPPTAHSPMIQDYDATIGRKRKNDREEKGEG